MKNAILEKYRQGVPSVGTITHLRSTSAVECLGVTGLDYVLIDMEHTPVEIGEAQAYISAADAAGITPIIRIAEISRGAILKMLDAGAKGVIVPGVETVEQVKSLIAYAKFKPLGDRGYCMTRDGKWGYGEDYADGMTGYMAACNRDTLLLPQCETLGCLEHIEEITAMDGVDGILIGPFDLSIAMGLDGQFTHPEFKKAVARILTACKANGKLAMIFTGKADDIMPRVQEGFDSVLYGLDILAVIDHYKAVMDHFHQNND